jgi:Xaa-Pro aminopeptidase
MKTEKELIMTSSPDQRFAYPIPDRELERRWELTRKVMKEQEIDCLIMQNDHIFLGGYVRYYTDLPANGYRTTVIFPADDEMTVINHGGVDDPPSPPDWAARGIKNRICLPFMQVLHFSNTDAADAAVKLIKDCQYKRIGFVGLDGISASFYQFFTENLSKVDVFDASDLVDEIKAVKSADEIDLIRKTAALHDQIASAVPDILRPGRYEYEIRNEIKKLAGDMGSEEQNIILGTDANRPSMMPPFFENRKIEAGDKMVCLIEVNGPGGIYGELARVWCLGEPSRELLDAFEAAKEAQKIIAGMLIPGANPGDLLKANNEYLVGKGYAPEGRLFGHGQGYDMVERPAFVSRETMMLKENMLVAVHPTAVNTDAFAFCCDNFLITANGAEMLTKTPQIIIGS